MKFIPAVILQVSKEYRILYETIDDEKEEGVLREMKLELVTNEYILNLID